MSARRPEELGYSRLAEQQQPGSIGDGAAVDPSALIGEWVNADEQTCCLRAVRLEAPPGALAAALEPAFGRPDDYPAFSATGHVEISDRTAYAAVDGECTAGAVDVRIEGNLNAGLLVLCCYKTWHDARAPGCFSREYFSKHADPRPRPASARVVADDALFHGVEVPEALSPAPILGHWRNADDQARGLCELWIRPGAEGVSVSAAAHGDVDWGEAPGRLLTDVVYGKVGGVAAYARFDFGFVASSMQIRETKGVLVVASFCRFADRTRGEPSFVREFFYRCGPA